MVGIPPVEDSDIEDVAWALQTAASLWKRNERGDALVWLRRAAQAAGEASMDDRALALARCAAELTELLQDRGSAPPPAAPQPPPGPTSSVEVLVDFTDEARERLPSFPLDGASEPPPAVVVPENTERRRKPPLPTSSRQRVAVAEPSAPSFQEAHAGMLDPWAESSRGTPAPAPRAKPPSHTDDDESVVTSARMRAASHTDVMEIQPGPHFPEPKGPPRAAPPPPRPPPLPPRAKKAPPADVAPPPLDEPPPPPPVGFAPPPEDVAPAPVEMPEATAIEAHGDVVPRAFDEPVPDLPDDDVSNMPTPIPPSGDLPAPDELGDVAERTFAQPATGFPDLAASLPLEAQPRAELPTPPPPSDDEREDGTIVSLPPAAPPPEQATLEPAPSTDPEAGAPNAEDLERFLGEVEGLSDLPDDARAEFARAARVHVLAIEEEVGQFALALVLGGDLDVAATMVDAPAARIGRGVPLRSRGTTEEGVPMRLIAASEGAIVATWNDAEVEAAFKSCPWVEEDLRSASDRVQTLVGVTIGPFGERLDTNLRDQVASKLEVKSLAPGEVIVEAGRPVPGLLIVGVGEVELVRDGAVVQTLGSGEFLFPDAILGAGAAPAEARAGKGGVLVMFGNRMVAQELLVTCPPLLEVFAGM